MRVLTRPVGGKTELVQKSPPHLHESASNAKVEGNMVMRVRGYIFALFVELPEHDQHLYWNRTDGGVGEAE